MGNKEIQMFWSKKVRARDYFLRHLGGAMPPPKFFEKLQKSVELQYFLPRIWGYFCWAEKNIKKEAVPPPNFSSKNNH